MTAKDIANKALVLMGYNDMNGNTADPRFQVTALNAVNFVYADLFYCIYTEGFKELGKLSEDVDLPERVLNDVMPYGVASYIAKNVGDGDNQQYFAQIYNTKRRSVSLGSSVEDVIPAP
jgi:hypothetical protein